MQTSRRQNLSRRWPIERLDQLLVFLTSGSRGWAKYYSESGAMFLRIQNVGSNGLLLDDIGFVNAPDSVEATRTLAQPGDVLLSITADLGRTAVVPKTLGRAHINQHLAILRVKDVDPSFLSAFLASPEGQKQIVARNRHGVKAGLNFEDIRSLEIPVPPIPEQRRLAVILDTADALRAKRRAALAQLDTLTQSIFLEMFGDPVTNPKGWPVRRLADILTVPLRNGLSPSHAGRVSARVLTLSAITGNEFNTDAWKTSTFQSPPPSAQSVQEDDFLICRGNGNLRLVGKGFFPTRRMPDVTFPDTMIAAGVSPDRVERAFLQHVWNSTMVRRQIESVARTTNGTFKINQTMLQAIGFVMPPRPLQRYFAGSVAAIAKLKATHRTSLAELDTLFASLQHRAFRGEL